MGKTLVFGASLKPNRISNLVVNRLLQHNIETAAFGLKSGVIEGVTIQTDLSQFQDIHTITMYVGPARQPMYYDEILKIDPERVIFNPGTENQELEKILEDHGIDVEVACTLVLLATNQY